MAYDEGLAERIRDVLSDRSDVTEKRMFGGLAFLVRGHMCVGIVKADLMIRVGPGAHAELIREPHAREMDFTGRPMKGFVYVSAPGFESATDLERWMGRGVSYASSLPPKALRGRSVPANKRMRRPSGAPRSPRERVTPKAKPKTKPRAKSKRKPK